MNEAPRAWKATNLGELCDIDPEILGGETPGDYEFEYIDIASVESNKISRQLSLERFSTAPSRARKRVRRDDVLMATVRPNLQAFARVDRAGELIASTGFAVLRAKPGVSDAEFIKQILFSNEVGRQIEGLVAGSNYPAINIGNVRKLRVLAPPLEEQRRISTILAALDEKIEKTEALIAKLDVTRSGVVRDVLSKVDYAPRVPLKLLAEIGSGVTLGRKFTGAGTAEYPYLRVANVQDGAIDLTEIKTVRIPVASANKAMLQPGDVLMNEGGDFDKLGRGAVWDGRIPNCLHQNHVFRVRCDKSQLFPGFLALWAASDFGKRFFKLASKQSTNLASINSTQLKSFPVLKPTLEEQREIVDAAGAFDSLLVTNRNELAKLLLQKRGLMRDLLTGKVRVSQ